MTCHCRTWVHGTTFLEAVTSARICLSLLTIFDDSASFTHNCKACTVTVASAALYHSCFLHFLVSASAPCFSFPSLPPFQGNHSMHPEMLRNRILATNTIDKVEKINCLLPYTNMVGSSIRTFLGGKLRQLEVGDDASTNAVRRFSIFFAVPTLRNIEYFQGVLAFHQVASSG